MATSELPHAFIVHRVGGRTRLRVPEMHNQAPYFARVREQLSTVSGVRRVTTDARTSSVLVEHGAGLGDVNEIGVRHGLFTVQVPVPGPDLGTRLRRTATRIDGALHRATGGRIDADGATALVLAGLGLRQIMNGRALPAGLTLLSEAIALLRTGSLLRGEKA